MKERDSPYSKKKADGLFATVSAEKKSGARAGIKIHLNFGFEKQWI